MADFRATASRIAGSIATAALIAGCTSGNSAIEPPFQSQNLATVGKLQFAVGTANIATGGTPYVGLNTVETFRQKNGLSAVLVNDPQIVGPAGFTVPIAAISAGTDAGTNAIGTATFGASGQATGYGFGPNNADTSGAEITGNYALPMYCEVLGVDSDSNCVYPSLPINGTPPAFPTNEMGFDTFNPGFVFFAAPAVSGAYALAVTIPVSAGSSQKAYTYNATATLNAGHVLPALATPTIALDTNGDGGGSIAVAALPAGVIEELVEVVDTVSGASSLVNFTAPGTQAISTGTVGGTNGSDEYLIIAIGFDYDWFGPAYPANVSQTPAILGSAGQDDITVAFPGVGNVTASSKRRFPLFSRRHSAK